MAHNEVQQNKGTFLHYIRNVIALTIKTFRIMAKSKIQLMQVAWVTFDDNDKRIVIKKRSKNYWFFLKSRVAKVWFK